MRNLEPHFHLQGKPISRGEKTPFMKRFLLSLSSGFSSVDAGDQISSGSYYKVSRTNLPSSTGRNYSSGLVLSSHVPTQHSFLRKKKKKKDMKRFWQKRGPWREISLETGGRQLEEQQDGIMALLVCKRAWHWLDNSIYKFNAILIAFWPKNVHKRKHHPKLWNQPRSHTSR
jgi:hypothetical protein